MHLAQSMSEAVISRTKRFYAALIQQDPFDRDDEIQMVAQHARDFIQARQEFLQQSLDTEEKRLIKKISDSASKTQPIVQQVLEDLEEGLTTQAMSLIIRQTEQLQQNVIQAIVILVDHAKQNTELVIAESRIQDIEVRNLLLFLTTLLIIIGATIATFVVRKVNEQSQHIIFQANHDSLTGLINRSTFETALNTCVQEKPTQANNYHVLYYLDLDQFKIVNDSCGHHVGDKLLQELTLLLKTNIADQAILARLGGDEFGVLQTNVSHAEVYNLTKELLDTVRSFRFTWDSRIFYVGVSIGIYRIDKHTSDAATAMSAADAACYSAKDGGRNRAHFFQDKDLDLTNRMADMGWLNRINQALKNDHFQLYQQEIKSLKNNNSDKHYEILLRLKNQKGKILTPGAFMPPAERFGLMPEIDRWVIDQLITWLENYGLNEHSHEYFSINLSGNSLDNQEFIQFAHQRIKQAKFPAKFLTFEITETAAINNIQQALKFIEKIKNLGCRFALDDFGSGLSSFGYLKQLPVDYLKIDGLFVKNCINDPIDLALVHSIHEIGNIMNMETIAEFVENKATLDILTKLGIDYAQGNFIAKPAPLDQLYYDKLG